MNSNTCCGIVNPLQWENNRSEEDTPVLIWKKINIQITYVITIIPEHQPTQPCFFLKRQVIKIL